MADSVIRRARTPSSGPMASLAARTDLVGQVEDAIAKGATVHLGGQVPDGPGAFYPATVLTGVTPEMRAYREELFGPVAVLYQVDSVDEAIDAGQRLTVRAWAVRCSPVTSTRLDDVANRFDVGMVGLNTTVKSAPDLPFGGVKNSGIGRELGRFGLDEFANKKLVRIV